MACQHLPVFDPPVQSIPSPLCSTVLSIVSEFLTTQSPRSHWITARDPSYATTSPLAIMVPTSSSDKPAKYSILASTWLPCLISVPRVPGGERKPRYETILFVSDLNLRSVRPTTGLRLLRGH